MKFNRETDLAWILFDLKPQFSDTRLKFDEIVQLNSLKMVIEIYRNRFANLVSPKSIST